MKTIIFIKSSSLIIKSNTTDNMSLQCINALFEARLESETSSFSAKSNGEKDKGINSAYWKKIAVIMIS